MAINELCTNALKYGALSAPGGRIEITAETDKEHHQFCLRWKEDGGPPVKPPTRQGFGTRLIQQSFVNQLKGAVRLSFEPSGVVCPFSRVRVSPEQTNSSETRDGSLSCTCRQTRRAGASPPVSIQVRTPPQRLAPAEIPVRRCTHAASCRSRAQSWISRLLPAATVAAPPACGRHLHIVDKIRVRPSGASRTGFRLRF